MFVPVGEGRTYDHFLVTRLLVELGCRLEIERIAMCPALLSALFSQTVLHYTTVLSRLR